MVDVLSSSVADIRAALKPTDELSCLSSRAKPPVAWGSSRRIQVGSERDAYRKRYRDAEWRALRRIGRRLGALFAPVMRGAAT